ncbi:YeiH family protein [Streptomyces sp. MUSC 125]|uniref:YeiH family protein n=1 Tax=Streptomyces sp. MUSC 125 TaxID=1428624 RepID=UPI000A6CBB25|nr:putative sulfate exporter family transporter [Streptomyces sp. MUSC 125]
MSFCSIRGYKAGAGLPKVVIMKDAQPSRSGTTRPARIATARGPGGAIRAQFSGFAARLPGLALAVGVALVATALGRLVPVVGAPVSAIVLGVLVALAVRPGERMRPGIAFAGRGVLQAAVVVLGAQLSLGRVLRVGAASLPVMIVTLAVCLAAAYGIGRRLGVVGDLRTLIGVGTGICGASAIAAVTPVIGAAEAEVAYAVSTIFVFNVAAVLAFPALGHLLGMGQHAFGLFAGTAVNDMSSVVAAATTYGGPAADYAVVVKLARTLLIIPVCLGLAALVRRRARTADGHAGAAGSGRGLTSRVRVGRLVPWFLLGFLILAAANTAGLVPSDSHGPLSVLAVFLITVALSAIGLSTEPSRLRRTGPAPLLLGGCLWLVVSATSLAVQFLATRYL